jgi:membrane protein
MDSKGFLELVKDSFNAWRRDNASRLAAALSYYTVFSLAPLLVLAIAVAGQIYEEPRRQIRQQAGRVLGLQVADALAVIVDNAQEPATGLVLGLVGLVTLLLGASGVFSQLMGAFDVIWHTRPAEGRGIAGTIKDRLLAFTLVLLIGLLFLLTFIASAALAKANDLATAFAPGWLDFAPLLNIVLSLLLATLLFAVVYKTLPRVVIAWRDVWVGAAVTAVLFVVGKELIGLYLGYSDPSSGYGAAGSIIVLLVFIYYAAQIFLLGAEFTKLYARHHGSQVEVEEGALHHRVLTENEAAPHTVVAPSPAQEVRLAARPFAAPEARAPAALKTGDESRPVYLWLLATVVAFVLGILVGGQRR